MNNLNEYGVQEMNEMEVANTDGGRLHTLMWYLGYGYAKAEGLPCDFYFM